VISADKLDGSAVATRYVGTLVVRVGDDADGVGCALAFRLVVDDDMAALQVHILRVRPLPDSLERLERRHAGFEGVALVAIKVEGLLAQLVVRRAVGLGEVDEVDRWVVLPSSGEDAEGGGRGHGDLDH